LFILSSLCLTGNNAYSSDHINAEIASGMVTSKDKLMEYMTWTYFFRRLLENPSYYNLKEVEPIAVKQFLSDLVDAVVNTLVESNCVAISEDDQPRITYEITFYGQIASFYYLSYKTMIHFQEKIKSDSTIMELLQALCGSEEYALFPVRHNEDKINKEIAQEMSFDVKGEPYDSSHIKVALLIETHLMNFEFPNQEYLVDFKSAMDQALRVIQGMIDIAANNSWLSCTLKIIHIMQMLIQGQYIHISALLTVPHITEYCLENLAAECKRHLNMEKHDLSLLSLKIASLQKRSSLERVILSLYDAKFAKEIMGYISNLPLLDLDIMIPQTGAAFTKDSQETLSLNANEEYDLLLIIKRHGSSNLDVHAPRFPKKKEEGWFVCIGDIEHDYLIQIKRISVHKQSTCSVAITAPSPGNYTFTVFIMSDSYLGLDQQYDIPIRCQ